MTAVKKALPGEDIIYIFDRKHAPYGTRSDRYIKKRAEKVCSMLVARGVKLIIVACNTATAVAIEHLRGKFSLPIVGVEPPVKPAVKSLLGGEKALLLCTKATARQKRIRALVEREGEGKVIVAPMPTLASLIEQKFSDLSSLKGEIESILSVYDGQKVGAVALGCTHYYHLKNQIEKHYGEKVKIFTAEEGVVNRTRSVLAQNGALTERKLGRIKYIYI